MSKVGAAASLLQGVQGTSAKRGSFAAAEISSPAWLGASDLHRPSLPASLLLGKS